MNARIDPISAKYFAPLEKAEKASERLFYVTALVSLAVLFIDKATNPNTYTLLQVVFGLLVVAGVVLSLATKLYWAPRGAEKRISDFVSSAFVVNLTADRTQQYYNNAAIEPIRRAAFQLLENCFFTKEIARLMCTRRRMVVGAYAFLLIAIFVYRDIEIDFVLIAIQVIFSEEIASSIIRLEWLRAKTERVFDEMFRQLSASDSASPAFAACVIEHLVIYETAKATSNVTTSSELFYANNARLSAEWDAIRASLGA